MDETKIKAEWKMCNISLQIILSKSEIRKFSPNLNKTHMMPLIKSVLFIKIDYLKLTAAKAQKHKLDLSFD